MRREPVKKHVRIIRPSYGNLLPSLSYSTQRDRVSGRLPASRSLNRRALGEALSVFMSASIDRCLKLSIEDMVSQQGLRILLGRIRGAT